MPRYRDELIEEIRSKNDIVDVIGSVVKLKKSGSNYFGLCPFHNEKTGSFSVSPSKQMYYCFGCGKGGNVISFVMEYENYNFSEALKYLGEKVGVEVPDREESEDEKRQSSFRQEILSCLKEAAIFYYKRLYGTEGKLGLEYLKRRGLTDETIRSFGLGFSGRGHSEAVDYLRSKGFSDRVIDAAGLCNISEKYGMTDRFFNRVMFPIMDVNSHVIGFGGRVMGEGEPKYLNSPETVVFDKSHNMYGLNVARRSRKPYRIVCEGYMDVISMHQAGFTEAVASLGTAFTPGHASLLKRYTKDLKLIYDSDSAGIKAAMRAIPICRQAGLVSKVVHLDPYKDPDEFIKAEGGEEFQKRLDNAENAFFFELSVLEKDYDMSDPEGRSAFQTRAARKLASIEDEITLDNYISSVAAKYAMNEGILKRAVALQLEKSDGSEEAGRYEDLKKPVRQEKKEEKGAGASERYLLTWLTDDRKVYEAVKGHLTPDDFTEGVCRKLAGEIFEGYEKGELRVADIISGYAETGECDEVASIINSHLDALESVKERSKALTDLVINIKKASLERLKERDDGVDPLKKSMEEKKALEKLRRLRIEI